MCGISGIISTNNNAIDESTLKLMNNALSHRGPDDEGYYIDRNIGLAHRRLSIIDLSSGHQPLSNEDESIWITYNGEIYNYLELRSVLIQKGHIFKTNSDTEVLIHLYEEYGYNCLNKLNGMFAFVLYDKNKKIIFGGRDRLGIKPFYYCFKDDFFLFASEIKAILKNPDAKSSPNYDGINDYLSFQFCLGNKTLFKNIFKLLPGNYFTLDLSKNEFNIFQYWDLDFTVDTYHTEGYFIDTLLRLIEDSVRLRLRSDVEIGSHLSGGLDSSTIACISSSLLENEMNLKTFTGGFKESKEYDETYYAKLVSESAGTVHHEIFPESSDFINYLPELIYYMDEPAAGPGLFPQYCVSKLASENVKVVLGGQGGDEIFGGYARYLVAYLEQCIKGAIFETQEEGHHVVTLESIVPNLSILKQYAPMMQSFWKQGLFDTMERRYFNLIFRGDNNSNTLSENYRIDKELAFNNFNKVFSNSNTLSYLNKMSYFDIKASLPALLQVEDRTSMSVSLESRLPLLDYRIVELMAHVPPTIKYKGGMTKYLFKKAIKNVIPEDVFERKDKMGFPVPLTEWYNDKLKDYVNEILISDTVKERKIFDINALEKQINNENQFGRVIWGALNLELWFRTYIDNY